VAAADEDVEIEADESIQDIDGKADPDDEGDAPVDATDPGVDPVPPTPKSADEVSEENLRRVREQRRKEQGEAGLLRLRLPGRRGAPPPPPPPEAPGAPAAGAEPEPESVRAEARAMEQALTSTAAKGLPGLADRIREAWRRLRKATVYEEILRDFPVEKDEVRVFRGEEARTWGKAGEDVIGIVGGLADKGDLAHFTRIVLLRDYRARAMDERITGGLPAGIQLPEVEAKLARLEATANERVLEALDAHTRLMDAEREDLGDRGLLDPDRARADYYPHHVLFFEGEPTRPSTVRIQEPRRTFLKRARGSKRLIETDYIRAMFRHRAAVRYANAIDDFALTILARHDRRESLPDDVRRRLRPGQTIEIGGMPHKAIQYKRGNQIFPVQTIPEQLLADAIAQGEESLEVAVEDVRRYGALGRYHRLYVVPQPLAERFEKFAPGRREEAMWLLNKATSHWKWVTIGFWGQAGNLLNLTGDLMNLGRVMTEVGIYEGPVEATRAALAVPAAAWDVAQWYRGRGSDLIKLMEKYDVLSAGYVGNEVYFRARAPEMRQFLSYSGYMQARAKDAVQFYFRHIPEFREAVPRAAMARYQMGRIERGRLPRAAGIDIAQLPPERAAMKIAREFTVDYGRFTEAEDRLLRGLLLPFYAWPRQNTPNWLRFLWYAPLAGAALIGVRLLMELWNNWDPERRVVEQDMPPYKRNAAHIVTDWKDAQGKAIVIYFAGDPMADALGMVGMAGAFARLSDLATERISLSRAGRAQLEAVVSEPGQRVVGLLTPLVKVPLELKTGVSALTEQPLVPREMEGTTEAMGRKIRHAFESAFRPLREARVWREKAGREEGIDWLTHRYGLGLPFERVDPERARQGVGMRVWAEARDEYVEQALGVIKNSPMYPRLAPHQQEIMLREAARRAAGEFNRQMPAPVSRTERLRRRWAE